MFGHKRMRTVHDWLKLSRKPETMNKRLELIGGTIVETLLDTSGTNDKFAEMLQNHVNRQRLGRVVTNTGFRRSNDDFNVYMPDVAYISFERTMPISHEGIIPYMPDLVVLVKTPELSTSEIADRSLYYLKNGTSLVWIAHPDSGTVDVCSKSSSGNVRVHKVGSDGALMANDLLPGLMLVVQDIFLQAQPA